MSVASPPTPSVDSVTRPDGRRPLRDRMRDRRVLAAGGIVVIVAGVAAAVVVVVHPFGGAAAAGSGDNGAATGIARVLERPLSSQTAVAGTLGYGGTTNVVAPNGTSQQALTQAQQQLTQAQNSVASDQTALSDAATASNQTLAQDESAVTSAQSSLTADQAAENTDCTTTSPACTADKQAVSQDQAKLTQAQNQLASAQTQATQSRDQNEAKLNADLAALRSAQSALATAEASAVNPGTTYTSLPAVGAKVAQGQALYSVSGIPVPLFYGTTTLWRDLQLGVSDGPDVGELNANLIALGFGSGLAQSNHFSDATQAAVEAWQASIGAPQSGVVHLGDVVVEPGAVIVRSVTPSVGGAVQPGTIMQVTSTTRDVTVALDVGQQGQVKVGDAVTITLPNGRSTTGTVSFVGSVATTPSSNGNGGNNNSTPTIEVDITLNDPSAAGNLDQAPVQVSITTASVPDGLVVPVTSLVALSGGGYAVEVVNADGRHHLVAVQTGLFDDAAGLVQVTADGLHSGDHIVVPAT